MRLFSGTCFLCILIAATSGQFKRPLRVNVLLNTIQPVTKPAYDPSRYSGGDSLGRYDPNKDNLGRYDPSNDQSGRYVPDNSGAYNGDRGDRGGAGGFYTGSASRGGPGGPGGPGGAGAGYQGDAGRYRPDNTGAYNGDRGDRGGPGGFYTGTSNAGTSGGSYTGVTAVGKLPGATGSRRVESGRSYTGGGAYNYEHGLIRQEEDKQLDGYHYLYETRNTILVEESGKLEDVGTEREGMHVKGYYEFIAPNGVKYRVDYTSGPEGFRPVRTQSK